MNLRPSGYEGDFTQPADGRRPSCFQSSRVVSSSAKSTEVHAGIRKSPPVWTRSGQSSGEPLEPATFALATSQPGIHDSSGAYTNLNDPLISLDSPDSDALPGSTNPHADSLSSCAQHVPRRRSREREARCDPSFGSLAARQRTSTTSVSAASCRTTGTPGTQSGSTAMRWAKHWGSANNSRHDAQLARTDCAPGRPCWRRQRVGL